MRRRLTVGLFLLNALMGFAIYATPADSQVIPRGIFNCCKSAGPEGYCCASCCWFWPTCDTDGDCSIDPD